MLQEAAEILVERISVAVAFVGGIVGVWFSHLGELIATNATAGISLAALAISFYFNYRRDQREQEKHKQEMKK
jgi:hypothetical protein